jgi:hypothetical protein
MVEAMWLAMTRIDAQDLLNKMFVSDWPNTKKDARKKKHRELYGLAFPNEMRPKTYISPQDLQKRLSR